MASATNGNSKPLKTRAEQFDQLVRSIVTLGLLAGFLYGFYTEKISGEVFTAMFASVIGFWFGSRDSARQRATDLQTTTSTTDVGATTVTETKPRGE